MDDNYGREDRREQERFCTIVGGVMPEVMVGGANVRTGSGCAMCTNRTGGWWCRSLICIIMRMLCFYIFSDRVLHQGFDGSAWSGLPREPRCIVFKILATILSS